jgi:hypothetical protein
MDVDRFMRIKIKDEAMHDIMGNGGLGVFSAHPDANEAPPFIESPQKAFRERPENPKWKLKQ